MAEEQKPVEVAAQAADNIQKDPVAAAAPTTDAAPALDVTPATEEAKPATEETKAEETKTEEAKPVEEGHLGYKAQGLSFPKNLIPSKEFFFFGNEALEVKALDAYKKGEKHAETALNNIAWAAHTGKGLLFAGDKKAPTGVINLADASEPEVDGSNKFHLTAKGGKHTFKATNTAERDNWVAQIKAKIAEAKELATSVTESETYKNTLQSLKPAPKEEKPAEAAKEEPKAEEAKTEDAPKEEGEAAKEEPKAEEPAKRRSASRKRASFFGFGKKDLPKSEEAAPAEAATEDKPADADAPKAEEATEAADAPAAATPAEDKPVEEAESPKEKPAASKRNSIFGNVFSKKEKKATEAKPAEDAAAEETPAAAEEAPVIPPVESTTPLADEVNAETTDAPAVTNGDAKKDVKEKRKSSLPFAFGKRDKSPTPVNGDEKPKAGAFSKLRATIKGKGAAKADETKDSAAKPEEAVKEESANAEESVQKETTTVADEAPKPLETENKPESAVSATPAVTAAA